MTNFGIQPSQNVQFVLEERRIGSAVESLHAFRFALVVSSRKRPEWVDLAQVDGAGLSRPLGHNV